jgi:probable DNA metabolism protein
MSVIYVYDSTLEGLLTAVFQAFASKEDPQAILPEQALQHSLLDSYVSILSDDALASRVMRGIQKTLGRTTWQQIKKVFLSDAPDKATAILRYLRYRFKHGRADALAEPAVARFQELLRQVDNECEKARQFVRFSELEGGLYYARFEPRANVIPAVLSGFAARFNVQPFVIYDPRHDIAGVYDLKRWWLVRPSAELQLPARTAREEDYAELWRTFFRKVAIEQRRNPTCQRAHMPKRFWGNLTEMQPVR